MFSNEFVWCDLSTFDLAKASAFYGAVLGWSKYRAGRGQDDDYTMYYAGMRAAAGMYTMPDFFQSIRMPSFWMSYVRVESLEASVDLAIKLGAKCEIKPTPFDASSRFALIRDPAGAGFTLYEGQDLKGRDKKGRSGRMIWNELHVPDIDMVHGFYSQLFGWQIVPEAAFSGRYNITSATGSPIAAIAAIDESIKGPKNYWAVVFAVRDINTTLKAVVTHGGELILGAGDGRQYAMATDNQGAMFCLAEV